MPRKPSPKPASGRAELTALERQVMTAIWDRGSATAAEVGEALRPARPLAATTIHTVLANLRRKGYLEPIPTTERSMRLRPKVARERVAGRPLRELLRDYFGGSASRLMAHLIRERSVDAEELAEIRRLLDSKKDEQGR